MAITNDEYEENFCEFEEGDIYAEGFGLVASLVMRDKSISSMAKALYAYLMTFSNRSGAAWPSTNLILEEMSLSKNSFYKYRSELRDAGFLDWTTFGREGGGRRTVYRIFKIRKKEKSFPQTPGQSNTPKIALLLLRRQIGARKCGKLTVENPPIAQILVLPIAQILSFPLLTIPMEQVKTVLPPVRVILSWTKAARLSPSR